VNAKFVFTPKLTEVIVTVLPLAEAVTLHDWLSSWLAKAEAIDWVEEVPVGGGGPQLAEAVHPASVTEILPEL
jgi:hypothetical protein